MNLQQNNPIPPYIIQNGQVTPAQKLALIGAKLFVATPMYGGSCGGRYALALSALQTLCTQIGLPIQVEAILNESLVQRARNALTHVFMKSDCTHMLFIDSDINFIQTAPVEMLLASIMKKEPLLGATYSKKEIAWNNVEKHQKAGVRPEMLPHCLGSHVIHTATTGDITLSAYSLFPVRYLGTGFMMYDKSVLSAIAPVCVTYKNNHFPSVPIGERMTAYYDCEVRKDNYLSEDYLFCARAIDAGITPKLCPWVNLAHYGTYSFEGCFLCSYGGYVHDIKKKPKK